MRTEAYNVDYCLYLGQSLKRLWLLKGQRGSRNGAIAKKCKQSERDECELTLAMIVVSAKGDKGSERATDWQEGREG